MWELHGGLYDWPEDEEVTMIVTYQDGQWFAARRIASPEIGASPFRDQSVEWEGTMNARMFREECGFWLYFGSENPPPRPPQLPGWRWPQDVLDG